MSENLAISENHYNFKVLKAKSITNNNRYDDRGQNY